MKHNYWAFLPAVLVTVLVVALSLGNSVQLPDFNMSFVGQDKIGHGLAYMTLAVVWLFAFRKSGILTLSYFSWKKMWVFLFALGALLEVLQWAFYPERYFEFADMIANGLGAGFGCLGFSCIFPPSKR